MLTNHCFFSSFLDLWCLSWCHKKRSSQWKCQLYFTQMNACAITAIICYSDIFSGRNWTEWTVLKNGIPQSFSHKLSQMTTCLFSWIFSQQPYAWVCGSSLALKVFSCFVMKIIWRHTTNKLALQILGAAGIADGVVVLSLAVTPRPLLPSDIWLSVKHMSSSEI